MLNVIAVDDEQMALEISEQAIKKALPHCALKVFASGKKALEHAKKNRVDIAFLDIEMGGMNGIELAKNLKEIYKRTNIIFVTGYSQYALDSYSVKASEYLLKPVNKDGVLQAMEHLRHPIDRKVSARLFVQTFGNFEVFAEGKPLDFTYSKTKELFAYLVDRTGALCANNEIIAAIWEDKSDNPSLQSYFRNLVSDLNTVLKSKGVQDILIKKHGSLGILPDKFTCDLYDFINSVPYAVNSYTGEYMAQYSWAEFTNAYLDKLK